MTRSTNVVSNTFPSLGTTCSESGRSDPLCHIPSLSLEEFKKQVFLWAHEGDSNENRFEARDRIVDCMFPLRHIQPDALRLCDLGLKTIPAQIGCLLDLKHLDLRGNHLTQIPNSICRLKNLETLFLTDNMIVQLPEDLGRLNKLRVVDVQGNLLSHLPDSTASSWKFWP